MIYRDISGRCSGKSARIVQQAISTGANIATFSKQSVTHYKRIAEYLGIPCRALPNGILYIGNPSIGISIVAPISFWASPSESAGIHQPILVDDLTACMNRILTGEFAGYSDDDEEFERGKRKGE